MNLPELLNTLRLNANLPAAESVAIPAQTYSSPEFLELELTHIFNREWVCVGRFDEFANPGDYCVTTIGRDEVIVLRDRDGTLRAMSNICRHRMMSLLEGSGNLPGRITCPYHAWTYGLDGQLLGTIHMPTDFDTSKCRLPEFAVEQWSGWVYVNLDRDAAPLAPRLAPLTTLLENYQVDTYRTLFRVDEVWDTNWKILFENFMEPYHLFMVHRTTVEHALPTRLAEVQPGGPGFCLYRQGRVPDVAYEYGEAMSNPNPQLTEEEAGTVYLFGAYPGHVVSVSAERSFWLSLMPLDVDRVRVHWGVDVHPNAMPEGEACELWAEQLKKSFHAINAEDKPVVAAISRNARALAAASGRLSAKERTLHEFQRYLTQMLAPTPEESG